VFKVLTGTLSSSYWTVEKYLFIGWHFGGWIKSQTGEALLLLLLLLFVVVAASSKGNVKGLAGKSLMQTLCRIRNSTETTRARLFQRENLCVLTMKFVWPELENTNDIDQAVTQSVLN